jgi:RNA polymerase-binding transcription factor DksA
MSLRASDHGKVLYEATTSSQLSLGKIIYESMRLPIFLAFPLDFCRDIAVVCLHSPTGFIHHELHNPESAIGMTSTELNEITETILERIEQILEKEYHETLTGLTVANVAACVAFKAHPELNELRLALERMERGEYGSCIFCKNDIPVPILRAHPTAHFCDSCSAVLRYRTRPAAFHAAS